MKRRGKRILLIALAAVVLLATAGFAYMAPMLAMHPTQTGEVADTGILALHNGANSLYFVPVDGGYLLVDGGSSADKVARELPEIGVDPGEVLYILLTHSDYDHVAALALFPQAQIYMSSAELPMVNGTTKRNAFSRNALPEGISLGDLVLLEEGQQIELGGRSISCIAVPGHTPGSTAFLLDGRYLFTGDAFRVKDGRMEVHPFTMDSATARESIQTLADAKEEAALVLTAHYGWYGPGSLHQGS